MNKKLINEKHLINFFYVFVCIKNEFLVNVKQELKYLNVPLSLKSLVSLLECTRTLGHKS